MKKLICHLKNLVCHHCDERDGDELFITFNGKKIWPEKEKYVSGSDNCVIPINIKLPIEDSKVILQLWDYDLLFDDLLGEFRFVADGAGQFRSDLQLLAAGEHKFSIEFELYFALMHGKAR